MVPEIPELPKPDVPFYETGPLDRCPECGVKNSLWDWRQAHGLGNGWKRDDCPVHGRYCSPHRRKRTGFLWLSKCRIAGTHTHQECEACGARWMTTAKYSG